MTPEATPAAPGAPGAVAGAAFGAVEDAARAAPGGVEEVVVGDRFVVEVGPIAHGGHSVARAPDGRVVFVRHALPGERVTVSVTDVLARHLRADAVEVHTASPDRVEPPCPWAASSVTGRDADRPTFVCGGCDFQHVSPKAQVELKAAVVREHLVRLARLSPGEVEALGVRVEPLGDPLGWRTRVRYAVDGTGRAGLLAHRSHQVVPVDWCRIAAPGVRAAEVIDRRWPADDRVDVVGSSGGDVSVVGSETGLVSGPPRVRERAVGREWSLPVDAFWQVHPGAPDTLAAAVVELLGPRPHERAWDLYGGAGLFAAALAPLVAEVTLVESSVPAVAAARSSLADLSNVHIVRSTVERFRSRSRPDLVVLDPPRTGAGTAVVRRLAAARPRAIAYVACDPAAFARDVATLYGLGWRLATLRGYDCFPMTHHVECVGLLVPAELSRAASSVDLPTATDPRRTEHWRSSSSNWRAW